MFNNDKVKAVAENLTRTLIQQLEENPGDWSKPWQAVGSADTPHNPVSGTTYRGSNVMVLSAEAWSEGYTSGRWATYRQWGNAECQVRKGTTGCPIVRWNTKYACDKCGGSLKVSRCKIDGHTTKKVLFASVFTVFNADQVDPAEGGTIPVHADYPVETPDLVDPVGADDVRTLFAQVGVDWTERPGDKAFWSPLTDEVVTPAADQFDTVGGFAATVAHEFSHWTGHESRLGRNNANRFGSEAYAFEELIAELGSVFVCNVLGVIHEPVDNHAAYLRSWLKALKGDDGPTLLWKAATDAQKAAGFIVDRITDPADVAVAA